MFETPAFRNPLYGQVADIAERMTGRDLALHHRVFGHFRSQVSVRAVLTDLGYVPDCKACPAVWRLTPLRKRNVRTIKSPDNANCQGSGNSVKQTTSQVR